MPNGYDRLKTLLDSTKDEEEEETTATGSSTKKSGKDRLDALLKKTEGNDTPANTRSKAAYNELLTTGQTTYGGKTYTLPEGQMSIYQKYLADSTAGAAQAVAQWGADQMAARKAAEPEPAANAPRASAADPTPWKTVADYYQPVLEEKKAEANKPEPAGFANAKSYLDSAATQNINPALAGTLAAGLRAGGQEYKPGDTRPGVTSKELYTNADLMTQTAWAMDQQRDQMAQQLVQNPSLMYDADFTQGLNSLNSQANATGKAAGRLMSEYERVTNLRNEQEEKEKYGSLYKNEDYIKYNRGDADLAKKGESATDIKLNRYTNIYRRQGEQEWRDKGGDPTLSDAESFLTDREAGNYFYIAGKQGLDAANEYYKNYLKADAETRKNQAVMEYTQNKVANGNYATKLAYSGASIVMNKTSVAGMLDLTFQNLRQRFGDASKPINYNTKWQLASNQADAIVKQVSNDIAKDVAKAAEGTKWEKYTDLLAEGATFLYQTVLSTIDSGSSALLVGLGLPEQITLGLMAGNAGMSAIRDAKERGASDGQALASGYAAAFAEYMFEKVSLDQLLEAKNIQNFGQFVKEFNKQGFVEGSEEFATEWATTLTDLLINGDKSSISTDVQKYLANGVSEKEARKAAAWSWTKNIAMSFLGGYLSGGLMQGGNAAVNIATGGNSRLNLAAQVQVQMAVNQAINDNGRVDPDAVRMIENNPEALNMLRGTPAMKNGYRGGDAGKQQIQSAIREIAKQERTARTVLDHAQQARLMGEYTRMMVEAEQQEAMQAEMPEQTARAAEERIGPPPAETRADVGTEIPSSAEAEAPFPEGPPVPQDRAVNAELQQGTEQNSQLPVQDQQETAQERTAPPVPQQEQRQEAPTPPVPQSVQTAQERTPAQQQSLAKQRQQQTNTPAENLQERGFTTAGADTTAHVRDEQSWDAEEKAVAEQLRARGIEPVFVTGLLEDAQGNKVTFLAEGNRMAIQADHLRQTVQSIAEAALGAKLDVDAGVYQSTAEAAIAARTTPKARPVTRSARAQRSLDSAKQNGVNQKDAELAARLSDVLGRDILWYNDPARGGTWEDGKTINGAIYINAAVHKEPVVWVVAHELTHNTENAKVYKGLKNLAKQAYTADGKDWQAEVNRRVNTAKGIAEKRGDDAYLLKPEMAEQEMTADWFADNVLIDEAKIRQIVQNDPTTARGILSYLKNLLQKLKRKEPTIERAIDLYSKALKEVAAGAQEKGAARGGLTVGTPARSAQDIKNRKYSVQSIFNAAGFQVTMKGGRVIATDGNGQRITEMTEDMVRRSGIGTMIRYAQEVTKSISKAEAQTQVEGLTRLFNLMLKAQDGDMVWRFAGSAMFSAVKSNSDGQYSTTVDFSTVCKKTEEMMRTMSTIMMRTHKGLTKDQIIELQNDILAENGLVPCPVCYVFSRWAGVGGILDNMAKFQKKYDGAEWDDPARMKARIDQLKAATKTKKALQALLMEEDNAYQQFTGELEANQAEQKTLKAERKSLTGKKADAAANAARVAEIDKRLKELDGLNTLLKADIQAIEKSGAPEAAWLERVRSKPNYREEGYVEEDLLYNLLAADRLAEEKPLAWGYRTSRGPSAGKAILPYSDMRVGDWVLGPKANSAKGANPLFSSVGEQFSKDQTKAIDAAKMKVLAQNLIGGQRYQSTSDFMYDYGLDYLLSFFEGQMLGSKMQTYTKVMEFVNLVASVHGDVNISMMPLDAGYVTEADGRQHLIYSSVTGANPEAAIKANHLFDNAQLILVGINDQHILLALEDSEETGGAEIGFVIPYHASGASINNFIRGLVENLKETFDEKNYKNYEPMQNDGHRKNATATQEARERLRRYLLTGKRGKSELMVMTGNPNGLTDTEMKLLKGRSKDISDRSFEELREIEKRALAGDKAAIREYESWSAGFLGDLYKKMWTDQKAKDTYGVRLTGDQPDHIMPHEFWDTRVDREHAYINGFRFRSYCYSLGLTPRFTGVNSAGKHLGYGDFSDSKGYWKTLIDRPMYDRSGKYRDQQTMNVTELSGSISEENAGMLSPEYGREFWGENAQTPDTGVAARAAERYLERNEEKPRFSARTEEDYAPTFYSKLEQEIRNFKGDKIGAASAESYLRGHGVKEEEIKWSGIRQFLEGKKSVSKEELLDFVRANALDIEEETLNGPETLPYTDEEREELHELEAEKEKFMEEAAEYWQKAYGEDIPLTIVASDDPGRSIMSAVIRKSGMSFRDFSASKLGETERTLYERVGKALLANERGIEDIVRQAKERVGSNGKMVKWQSYSQSGGKNYREILFKMPGSDYTNQAMEAHWDGRTGVLAHARVQDFTADGDPVLFIEEIQSDWHNAGMKQGYSSKGEAAEVQAKITDLEKKTRAAEDRFYEIVDDLTPMRGLKLGDRTLDGYEVEYGLLRIGSPTRYHDQLMGMLSEEDREFVEKYSNDYRTLEEERDKLRHEKIKAPDAPFATNYHEFVLKNLIRQAAENGYDYVAWTTGKMQEERWSDEYAEGYRIEYDQNIPKFLNKYGKQWGTKVTEITLDENGRTVPAIQVNDQMRDSVLHQGQPRFSARMEDDSEVGTTLKTLKGSPIKRNGKYGVGKEIGGRVYIHKQYADDVIPAESYERAQQIVAEEYPDFDYNCVEYEPKTGTIRFDEAEGFDTQREPVVGDYVEVKSDGSTRKGHTDYIWHHKWLWVKNDYQGFDVAQSWNWSKQWLNTISGKTYEVNGKEYNDNGKADGNGIGRWNAQLRAYGLPLDGEEVRFSARMEPDEAPVHQAHTSRGTSINTKKVPALYSKAKFQPDTINIDIGAGVEDTPATKFLADQGVTSLPFDPFNRSMETNKKVTDFLQSGKKADTATCSNVLNVVDNAAARANIILEMAKAIKPEGTAYFTVYSNKENLEAGKAGEVKSKPDQWQEFREAKTYVEEIEQFFDDVSLKSGLIIAKNPKQDLPKAVWQIASTEYTDKTGNKPYDKDVTVRYSARSEDDLQNRIDTAIEMLDNGTRVGDIYAKTGLVVLSDGEIQDGFNGETVGRYDYGRNNKGRVLRGSEKTVSGSEDGRIRGRLEKNTEGTGIRAWRDLDKETRTRIIKEFEKRLRKTGPEGRQLLARAGSTAKLAESVYNEIRKEGSVKTEKRLDGYIPDMIGIVNFLIKNKETHETTRFSARAERPEGELGSRELLDTPALRKLGVKVTGSAGEYAKTESLIAKDRAAKSLQREARKAEKRLRATDAEKEFANGITAGIYREEDIPRRLNKQTVMELADYYWALNSANLETLHQVRTDINQGFRDEAQALLEDVDIKPQSMLKLNERTPERSFRAMFGDRAEDITRWMLDPVRENEAEKIRWYNKQMAAVKTFTDSKGKNRQLTRAESALVMRVMEGRAAADMVAGMEMKAAIQNAATNIRNGEDPGDASKEFGLSGQERDLAEKYAGWLQTQEDLKTADSTIVEAAAKKYAEIFDDYYAAINDFLVAHGYEPIGYIKGYAPHMQPEENQTLLEKAFKSLGINEEVKVLPASIAGQTAMYKPNKRWDPYFLRRNGGATGYDIVKAYQSYVDYMADILFHMDDIMRIRQTANWIRQTYSPEEIRADLDRAQQMLYASTEEKQSLLRDAKKIGQNTILSAVDTAKAMQDYVDDLYEKIGDTTEYSNLVMWLTNYADILAGKQSAADRGREYEHGRKLLNFGNRINNIFQKANVAGNLSSMLNQTAQVPMIAAELGEVDFTSALIDIVSGKTKNWALDSDFLTAKAGKEQLYSDNADKFINVLFAPASLMDTFVSTIAVRGAFNKAIRKGASYAEAMQTADAFGQSVMGSRAKGSRPLAYESKKFWSKMIHMFQVEAINSWDHLVTDLPYEIRTIARKQGKAKAAGALAALIIRALLGAFTLNRLSEELYGGTPAPFDILGLTANFVASGKGLSTNQYIRTVIDNAMGKMGYDRIFDTEALSSEDFDLEAAADDLIYNVMNDVPFARNIAGVFGLGDQTMPLPGAGGEFKALGTAVKGMLKDGVEPGEVESLVRATFLAATQFVPGGRQISKTAQGAEAVLRGGSFKGTISGTQKLQYPLEGATDTVKALLFGKNATNAAQEYWASGGNQLTEKMTTLYKSLAENGVGRKEAYDAIQKYRKIDNDDDLTSYERGKAERDLLAGLSITDSQKMEMYRTLSGADSRVEKFRTIMAKGLSFNKIMKVYDKYAELDNIDGMETKEKAAQFSLWVDKQNYSKSQKDAIKDQLKYYSHIPVTADRYEKLTERGLDPADAKKIDEAIDKLPVLPGNKEVTSTQKWRAALGVVKGEADQERALEALMSEEQFRKYKATNVSPSVYVTYKEATNGLESDKDASGKTISGSLKKKVVDYIDGLALTSDQKTALLLDYNSSYSTKDVTWHSSGGGKGTGSYAMARLVTQRTPEAPRAAKPRGGLVATGRPHSAGTGGLVLKKK